MTAPSPLERRYRRWLLAYPADYRRERGDELVATLLDLAEPGRTRPRPAEVLALLRPALAQRLLLRTSRVRRRLPAVLALLLALLPVALLAALADAVRKVCAVFGDRGTSGHGCPAPESWLEGWVYSTVMSWFGWAWIALFLVITALPVLFGGRRAVVRVAVVSTVLLLPALPTLGVPFLPSVAASWLGAFVAIRGRTVHGDRGGDSVAG